MAVWWKALALVPWVDVVRNVPEVVNGARKLWQNVRRQPEAAVPAVPAGLPGSDAVAGRVAQLEGEMRAASELIRTLAEQDGQLVAQIALLQRRLRIATWTAALAVALAMAALGVAWQRMG